MALFRPFFKFQCSKNCPFRGAVCNSMIWRQNKRLKCSSDHFFILPEPWPFCYRICTNENCHQWSSFGLILTFKNNLFNILKLRHLEIIIRIWKFHNIIFDIHMWPWQEYYTLVLKFWKLLKERRGFLDNVWYRFRRHLRKCPVSTLDAEVEHTED